MKERVMPVDRNTADELLYRNLRAIYHFERSLEDKFGMGYQGIYLLQLLRRRESARISEIAAALGIQIFSATRLVQKLEGLGYISKKRSQPDRRVVSVRLKSTGKSLVDSVEASNYELLIGNIAVLPKADQSAFFKVASNIAGVLDVEDRIDSDL